MTDHHRRQGRAVDPYAVTALVVGAVALEQTADDVKPSLDLSGCPQPLRQGTRLANVTTNNVWQHCAQAAHGLQPA